MNILKPCSYHYLFSHIPNYVSVEDLQNTAREFVLQLIEKLHLDQDETDTLEQPRPDVMPLAYLANNTTKTYLLQFLSNDILTSILVFNQTDTLEAPISYWKRTITPHFPETEDRIGQTTVLFAQAASEDAIVHEIAKTCFEKQIQTPLPSCLFDWGTLYFLPDVNTYVLLIPETENLEKGDQFLSFSFPMLESIRQKLLYEEAQAHILKKHRDKREEEVRTLLAEVETQLQAKKPYFDRIEQTLLTLDECQTELQRDIFTTKNLLHNLNLNITNFERYLAVFPIEIDDIFESLPADFRAICEQISANVEFVVNDAANLKEQWEHLRRKFYTLREKAEQLTPPVRIWEYELNELRSYYNRLKQKADRPETSAEGKKELNLVIEELKNVFMDCSGRGTMVDARVILEEIVEEMYRNLFLRGRGKLDLKELIDACYWQKSAFPENIYYSMTHVRNLGNLGAHPKEYEQRQTKEILSSLATVMEWYAQEKCL